MTELKIVRIATGEELICLVTTLSETEVNLKDVAILIPTEANSLGLAPFMAYSDASKGFNINTSFVMFMVDPVDGLGTQWQNMFSRVVTPFSQQAPKIII